MPESPNLRRRLGISRRDLLRRGAVVGGTLLWTVPVISTISRAHVTTSKSPAFVCCACRQPRDEDDPPFFCQPKTVDTQSQCQAACNAIGYRAHEFHISATGPFSCSEESGCGAHT